MLLYWDVTMGEELGGYFADVYPIEFLEDGAICAAKTKVIKRNESVECNTGANASEEAQDEEGLDDATVKSGPGLILNSDGKLELNIVFEKKSELKSYLKLHFKKLEECLVKRIAELEGDEYKDTIAIDTAKKNLESFRGCKKKPEVFKKFMDFYDPDVASIYTSPEYDHATGAGTPAIGVWNEDCTEMTVYFLNHSLVEMKL